MKNPARTAPRGSLSTRLTRTAVTALAVVAAAVASAMVAVPATAAPRDVHRVSAAGRGLGMQPLPYSISAASTLAASGGVAAAATVLPDTVDLTGGTVPVGHQGSIGSCVSWAVGYAVMGWYAKTAGRSGTPFAPMYVYSQTHVDNSSSGGGSYVRAAYDVVISQGIAERAVYTPQGDYDFRTLPTTAQRANAAGYKGASYSYLFSGSNQGTAAATAIKTALAAGKPVTLAIPVHSGFDRLNPADSHLALSEASGSIRGYHAIAAFGYDPTGVVIQNSWGTYWGKGGFATLGWDFIGKYAVEASTLNGLGAAPSAPVVTALSSTTVPARGGVQLTITASDVTSLNTADPSAVRLVSTLDPTAAVAARVLSRTVGSVTVTVPAAPVVGGQQVTGAYRVVLNNAVGTSADVAADDLTYDAPIPVSAGGALVSGSTGGVVRLSGVDFGTSSKTFTARKFTVTVDGVAAKATWVSDTALKLAVRGGVPGTALTIATKRAGVLVSTDTTARYVADISRATTVTAKDGARTLSLTGRGFAGSTGWALTLGGTATAQLPVVADAAALAAAASGVLLTSDSAAKVKLPLLPGGVAAAYTLSFVPDEGAYPGATYVAGAAAQVTYRAPKVTSLTTKKISTSGGSLTVRGSDVATVALGSGSVQLVNVADPSLTGTATVTARTASSLAVTLAPATKDGVVVKGTYRIVVTSPLGTSAPNRSYDIVTVV